LNPDFVATQLICRRAANESARGPKALGNHMTPAGFSKRKEIEMADDKSKRGGPDRRRVAGDEGYEVNYFARKHGISKQQAEDLIEKVGNNREKLNAAAAKLK